LAKEGREAMKKIYVIGAGVEGQEGFPRRVLELIDKADLLLGGERQLELFPDFPGEKVTIGSNLGEVVERLKKNERRAVVPPAIPFFGIGRYLLRNLPEEELEFVPNVSSVQYAFAKIKSPGTTPFSPPTAAASGGGRPIVANDKAAVLTDEENTPKAIAPS
jgi:precorrin-6Y C5,15-methyltransferase (decarboxylating)